MEQEEIVLIETTFTFMTPEQRKVLIDKITKSREKADENVTN